MKLTYQGNPGALFPFHPEPLNPGDTIDVPDEHVAGVGEDFTKPKTKPAPAADPED